MTRVRLSPEHLGRGVKFMSAVNLHTTVQCLLGLAIRAKWRAMHALVHQLTLSLDHKPSDKVSDLHSDQGQQSLALSTRWQNAKIR